MEVYKKTNIFYYYYYIINNIYMAEYEKGGVIRVNNPGNNILLKKNYYTKSSIFKEQFLNTNPEEEIFIDQKNITEYIGPHTPLFHPINVNLPTNVTIDKVNNVLKKIVLVLANSSLFVPLSYIGGKANTKKNKSKKKINNNN